MRYTICTDCYRAFFRAASLIEWQRIEWAPKWKQLIPDGIQSVSQLIAAEPDAIRINNNTVGFWASVMIEGTSYCQGHAIAHLK